MRSWASPASFLLALGIASNVAAAEYYLDDAAGSDSADGKSASTAWKTLSPLGKAALAAGDIVRFKSGGKWDAAVLGASGIVVQASGSAGAPLTFTRYGSGPAPLIENTTGSTKWVRAFSVHGSHVVIDGLRIEKAFESAIVVENTASEVRVQNCEVVDVGLGVIVRGSKVVVTRNHFHDLHMVNNTQGGDDDYGAVAVAVIDGSQVEISRNRMERCVAPSFDYEKDGGAVELYADTASSVVQDISVLGNVVLDGEGFLEVGGQGGKVENVHLAYNVSSGNRVFNVIHTGGTFGVSISGFRVENNTIVELGKSSSLVYSTNDLAAAEYAFRNNLVVLGEYSSVFYKPGAAHDHNLFHLTSPSTSLGVSPGSDEIFADPELVDASQRDFHLSKTSPAIDQGVDLGMTEDLEQSPVPQGVAPDIGAYEWQPASIDGGPSAGGTAGSGAANGGGASPGGAAGNGGSAGVASNGPSAASSSRDDSGCACHGARSSERRGGALVLALIGLFAWRSRAHRARRAARVSAAATLCVLGAWAAACGGEDEGQVVPSDGGLLPSDAGTDASAASDAAWPDADAPADATTSTRAYDPCATASCWTAPSLGACGTTGVKEDFSSGLYNAHRYLLMAPAGVEITLTATRTAGTWEPRLILHDEQGTTVHDSEASLTTSKLAVATVSPPPSPDGVGVRLEATTRMHLSLYVTGASVITSGFSGALPADAKYSLDAAIACPPPAPLYVRGVKLDPKQELWVRYVAENVVPRVPGTPAERIDKSAYVTWWALKEGVLNVNNPLSYSNCSFPPDKHIGPVELCPNPGNAWQVGLSGVQAAYKTLANVEGTALGVYPQKTIVEILEDAAVTAGFGTTTALGQMIAESGDRLRLSWLLRNAPIGFAAQYPTVYSECFVDSKGWCFGTGFSTSAAFAPTQADAKQAVADLKTLFQSLAP